MNESLDVCSPSEGGKGICLRPVVKSVVEEMSQDLGHRTNEAAAQAHGNGSGAWTCWGWAHKGRVFSMVCQHRCDVDRPKAGDSF